MKFKLLWISMFIVCIVFIFLEVKNTTSRNVVVSVDEVISPEKMLEDFEFITESILSIHPDPLRNFEGDWEIEVNRIKESLVDPLSVGEFLLRVQKFVSKVGDAHTLVTFGESIEYNMLPIFFEWVEEELVVKRSYLSGIHVGDRVEKIGDKEVSFIKKELGKFASAENEFWRQQTVLQFIMVETYLRFLNVVNEEQISLTLIGQGGESRVVEVDLYSREHILEKIKKGESFTWFGWEIFEEEQVGYFYLKECMVSEEYELSVTEFFERVTEAKIDKIILDLRDNGGGDSRVIYPFLQHFPPRFIKQFASVEVKFSEEAKVQRGYDREYGKERDTQSMHDNIRKEPTFKGELFVLVNNGTFSSASMFATMLHDNHLGEIIGEPTGGAPSAFGDLIVLDVPNSSLLLAVSHKEFLRPKEDSPNENTLHPNILIEKTIEDVHTHQDKYLQRVRKAVSN